MEALLISTGIVALAEIGDKTQLLSFILAAKFRRPWPICLGILVATLANHALAGALGAWITTWMGPQALRWVLGLSFIAMAGWIAGSRQVRRERSEARAHGRVRDDAGRVLSGRDGRQDPGGHGGAGRAVPGACPWCWAPRWA
jgi:putative Ca2+/H+ antiporter (TMEM165/GDT1 family)